MTVKSRADLLASSAAFLERCRDEERAEIIERLCQSAAAGCPWLDERNHLATDEFKAFQIERKNRLDLFEGDCGFLFPRALNIERFPDLYGEWVYQP